MKKEVVGTKETLKNNFRMFGNLRVLVCAALLAALSIIFGKFLQIPNPFQEFIRISFENTPIIMAGIFFGPVVGFVTGAIADVVGCVLYGYTINPIITLGAATVGFLSGFVSHYVFKKNIFLKTAFSVLFSHLIGSVVIKSLGLAAWYLTKYEIGLGEFMLWRLLNYVLVGIAEFAVISLLLRNKSFSSQLERIVRKK